MEPWLRIAGIGSEALWWGNAPAEWLAAFASIALVMAGWWWVRVRVRRQIQRLAASSAPRGVRLLAELVAQVRMLPLLALAVVLASKWLDLAPRLAELANDAMVILLTLEVGILATTALRFWLREQQIANAGPDGRSEAPTLTIVYFVARLLIWLLVGLVALDNLGVNITALLTGLGIGGIAVALAVQNVLGDLFASLSIALDKPFLPGDAIEVDTVSGTVEYIGIKSTRIRSVNGELVVVSNADLLKSRVRNFGRAAERRKLFQLCVHYGTPVERLRQVPALVEAVVRRQPGARFERCHLRTLGDSGAVFEVVFFSDAPEFEPLVAAEHEVNLGVLEALAGAGISLAYPTRTVLVEREA
jgi:small-conductance mechanosensitive channel